MVTATLVAAVGWAPSVLIVVLLLAFTFFLLAVVCDEALAPTLEELSDSWQIPHDVACATFLAAGSSAPEIAISLMSVVHGQKNAVDLSLGTLMGSALIAYTVIPAACILVSPNRELKLDIIPLARDVGFFCIGLLCVVISANDGSIDTYESGFLVSMFFLYLGTMKALTPFYKHSEEQHHFLSVASESELEAQQQQPTTNDKGSSRYGAVELVNSTTPNVQSNEEAQHEYTVFGYMIRHIVPPFHLGEDALKQRYFWILSVSILYISVLSEMTLYFAETLSDLLGVSHHLTGLVLVALGAQVPDTVASMAVARHGEGPSSIANAIGSQVLNINLGIGLPFLISNLIRGHAVKVVPSSDSGLLIFGTVVVFLAMVLLEKVTLKMRNGMILSLIYLAVIVGYAWRSAHVHIAAETTDAAATAPMLSAGEGA